MTTWGKLDPSFLECLFQGAGLGIVACDEDGTVTACNAAAAKLFRGTGLCAEGHVVAELFPESERPRVRSGIESCSKRLEPVEFRSRLAGPGAQFEFFVLMTPVLEHDGSLRGIAIWFRDISTQVQLHRSMRKRERLTSLSWLSGAVAHHFNNLLFIIATSVEYAMNMNTMTAMRRALLRSSDAIARATEITRQLLAFAQADHQSMDLADLTETTLYYFDENEKRLKQHGIELDLDWQVVPIYAVRREPLLIVLNNLVQNAIDAMPGGGRLTVRLEQRGNEAICLSITDCGRGCSAEQLEHLFEPFYTTKGELGSGTGRNAGMGLAVAYGLISEMHGTIAASSLPGQGARFDIVFPLDEHD